MNNFVLKSFKKYDLVLFFLNLFLIPLFCGMNLNFASILIYSHFPAYATQNIFLIWYYKKISSLSEINNLVITRYRNSVQNKILVSNLFCTFVYQFSFLTFLYLFYGSLDANLLISYPFIVRYIVQYICISCILTFFETCIISFSFYNKNNIYFIAAAIAINMIFHYVAVPIIFPVF